MLAPARSKIGPRAQVVTRERMGAGESVYRISGAPAGSGDRVVQTEAVDGRPATTGPKSNQASAIREPIFQQDAAARSHMGEVADAEGWVILPQPRPFPESVAVGGNGPGDRLPVEHFHQRRDRPDVALGDELASSALNLAKANPRLRPLHLVVRETEFCGLRLAGYFRRRMRENSRNSVRRPRCASLTRRNYGGFCLPGNRPGLSGLHGGGRSPQEPVCGGRYCTSHRPAEAKFFG